MLTFDLKKLKQTNIFVETGFHRGDGVQKALEAGFDRVFSIEIRRASVEAGKERFSGPIESGRVHIIHGKSEQVLGSIIEGIDEPITFWLDAHLGQGHVDVMDKDETFEIWCPLYYELQQIKAHHRNDHVILIDDIDQMLTQREKHQWIREVEVPTVESLVTDINPDYEISRINQGKVLYARVL